MGSFHQLAYHIVFATKYRRKSLEKSFREQLYEYVGGILRQTDGHLIEVGGTADHVHMLANISPTIAVSDCLRALKANSSKWINEQRFVVGDFHWQKGYAAFTVSYSQCEVVRSYIQNQELHHRQLSFEEEFVALLRRHHIPFEHRYLFEQEYHG
jgi:REP element-mobilizing transposase RayT